MSTKPEANGGRSTSPTPPAVSAATYGKIDAAAADKPAWMTRIPPKLAQAFEEAPEGTVLGTFTFTKGGSLPAAADGNAPAAGKAKAAAAAPRNGNGADRKVEQTLSIRISDELGAKAPDLPVEYTIEALTRKVPTLHPFTRKPDGSIELHATVAKGDHVHVGHRLRADGGHVRVVPVGPCGEEIACFQCGHTGLAHVDAQARPPFDKMSGRTRKRIPAAG